MNIIIVGGGKVGKELVADFNEEEHNVILIDTKREITEQIQDEYDVMGICGSGTDIEVLKEAGIKNTDLFVSVTESDEFNALCCVMAKNLGAKRCVARVRNTEYFKQIAYMRDALGINLIINPEYYAGREIARNLRFPAAIKTEIFARGRVEMAEMLLPDSLDGKALKEIYKTCRTKVLICAVVRDGSVEIPNGDFILRKGDRIHVTASHSAIASFMEFAGVVSHPIKSTIIVGGGRIAYYLARQLVDSGIKVKIIEKNMKQCELLADNLPSGVTIACGDGSEQQVLDEEGIKVYDSLVALTGIDEENILISMYAKIKQLKKVITKIDHFAINEVISATGIDSIITPREITADAIIGYSRAMEASGGTEVRALYRLVEGKAEAIEFRITQQSEITNIPLKDLKMKNNMLVAVILKGNKIVVPDGNSTLEVGDTMILITKQPVKSLSEVFA